VRVAVTGATGLIGRRLVAALRARGDEVTVLTRDPDRARRTLEAAAGSPADGGGPEATASAGPPARRGGLEAFAWRPLDEPAPADALAGRDGVVHLAGENVAQRWTPSARRAIRETRTAGTANLVAGLRAAAPGPRVLVCASGVDYYGAHRDEPLDESAPPGDDFLARVCVDWEAAASAAAKLGVRVVVLRTGVVLDRAGGALAKMLPPFRLGLGGPVAGGSQYVPWIHLDDLVGMYLAALDDERWTGPVNATAEPVTNRELSHALGRALGRPAVLPVPGVALRALYGGMAEIVTQGRRARPARARELGFEYRHPELDEALRSALGG
jgi:uncharacterized protein (TIGR01777 family)